MGIRNTSGRKMVKWPTESRFFGLSWSCFLLFSPKWALMTIAPNDLQFFDLHFYTKPPTKKHRTNENTPKMEFQITRAYSRAYEIELILWLIYWHRTVNVRIFRMRFTWYCLGWNETWNRNEVIYSMKIKMNINWIREDYRIKVALKNWFSMSISGTLPVQILKRKQSFLFIH